MELLERKEADGSLSIERSLPVDSKKLFTARPSLHRTQSRLLVASYKINRSRSLLRTIRWAEEKEKRNKIKRKEKKKKAHTLLFRIYLIKFHLIRQVHLELYRVSKSYSNIYGIQISLEVAISVIFNIYILYDFYTKFEKQTVNTYELIHQFIIFIFCIIQYSLKIFSVNYICDNATKEVCYKKLLIPYWFYFILGWSVIFLVRTHQRNYSHVLWTKYGHRDKKGG